MPSTAASTTTLQACVATGHFKMFQDGSAEVPLIHSDWSTKRCVQNLPAGGWIPKLLTDQPTGATRRFQQIPTEDSKRIRNGPSFCCHQSQWQLFWQLFIFRGPRKDSHVCLESPSPKHWISHDITGYWTVIWSDTIWYNLILIQATV